MATKAAEYKEGIKIVPFEMTCLDEVMEIENQSFAAPWSRDSYLDLAPLDTISFYVVKDGDKVIGYMLYQTWEEEMELHTIAVTLKSRRHGIGEQMIKFMMEDASSRGVKRIFLQVRPSNTPARTLYSKFEFQIVGMRPRYYRDNEEDALVMRLDLKP